MEGPEIGESNVGAHKLCGGFLTSQGQLSHIRLSLQAALRRPGLAGRGTEQGEAPTACGHGAKVEKRLAGAVEVALQGEPCGPFDKDSTRSAVGAVG